MKEQDARLARQLSGIRLGFIGVVLIVLAFLLWLVRDAIPELATTRAMATASVTLWHGGSEADVLRAFSTAQANSAVEASFEREGKPDPKAATWYLRVTADTPEKAKAQLAALCDAITAAVPDAGRNLMVSQNNSTVGAPNTASQRLSIGVLVVVMLLMLGGQLLVVVGAWREGENRIGMLASLAAPFAMLIFNSDSASRGRPVSGATPWEVDWKFILMLFVLTTIPLLLGLFLTRKPRPAAGKRRRNA
jgi:hypothetical protein